MKPVERNYSTTECEALGVKEALIKFQPFIEGERNIVITDHAALVWAWMYKNTNRRLVAWGTVFGAFPGLDIVHRAGKVHSNMDPLSRLPRIPPHQSPAVNETHPISESIAEQPIKAWESIIKEPALKATFLAVTWEDMLEASPEDPSAWMVMRRKARELSLKEQRVEEKGNNKQKGGLREAKEMSSREKEKGANMQRKVEQRPGQLVVSIVRGNVSKYVNGYLEEHWKASLSMADELVAVH